MTDYISREAAMTVPPLPKEYRNFTTINLDDAYELGWDDALQNLKNIPADDVRPVVRGEWIPENSRPKSSMFYCSVCHRTAYDPQPNRKYGDWQKRCRYAYCPNCGADMRKEADA